MTANSDEFLKIVKDAIEDQIAKRVEKEIQPKMQEIVAQEVAKIGVMVSAMFSVERFGQDVRIVVFNRTKEEIHA
jgi:hypothetical protein